MTTTRPPHVLMTAFIAIAAFVFAIAATPLLHIAASVVA